MAFEFPPYIDRTIAESATPEGRLLRAIANDDVKVFNKALQQDADVNVSKGAPLQLAADIGSPLMLRMLLANGADLRHALTGMRKIQRKIPRERKWDDFQDKNYNVFPDKKSEEYFERLEHICDVLYDLHHESKRTAFLMSLSLDTQGEMLRELRRLNARVEKLEKKFNEAAPRKKKPAPRKPAPKPARVRKPAPRKKPRGRAR
jgi:hypothetical protein